MKKILFFKFFIVLLQFYCIYSYAGIFDDTANKKVNIIIKDKALPISSQTTKWLYNNSGTFKSMAKDVDFNNSSNIYLDGLTYQQFAALANIIENNKTLTFDQLCKKPTIKCLIDILYTAHFLEIESLQTSLINEIAHRYYTYPSLAMRHANKTKVQEKYIPDFQNTLAEQAIGQKILELSQKNALLTNNIKCLKIIANNVSRICLTKDNKHILGTIIQDGPNRNEIFQWDASTGNLSHKYIYKGPIWEVYPIVSNQEPKVLIADENIKHFCLKNLQGDLIIKEWKNEDFLRYVYPTRSVLISPDENTIIACNDDRINFLRYHLKENNKISGLLEMKFVNPTGYDLCNDGSNYKFAFKNHPCLTNDGQYLIFKYRCGIKKLHIKTEEIETFNFIHFDDPNDEVSAIALTPDNSHIIAGVCESSCKTHIKILDFKTGLIQRTIDINPYQYCPPNSNYYPGKGWPYEFINSIAITPDGTKLIVSSKNLKTKIIDFKTGKTLQEIDCGSNSAIVGVTSDVTKIIVGSERGYTYDGALFYNNIAIYGNSDHEKIDQELKNSPSLEKTIAVLANLKKELEGKVTAQGYEVAKISPFNKIYNLIKKIALLIKASRLYW